MHQNEKDLNNIISSMLAEDEKLQDGANDFILAIIGRVVEAATIKEGTQLYRYSPGMAVTKENLVKRTANNLSRMSHGWTPYRFGLVDHSKEKLSSQGKILNDQFRLMLKGHVAEEALDELTRDLSQVLQHSWSLTLNV
ncbi:hypothetical protein [Pseudomonas sp. BJa3]|uniref:hypothetical protein n=1 Tax=unclassified Pseudomonas TaxID=196821 RepID=UPI002265B6C8|nr:hypothetical protein [Pseudomonas sp. BJa3]MCX5509694.1 hypothetical protein [Pseudomonas sp. BJa3]